MNNLRSPQKYSPLAKTFLTKTLYFLERREYFLLDSLIKQKGHNILEQALEIFMSTLQIESFNTNLSIVISKTKICSCVLNSFYCHIRFEPFLNENDFSSWNKIRQRKDEGKLRGYLAWFANRTKYQETYDYLFDLIVGEFSRMNAHDMVLAVSILAEMYSIRLLHGKDFYYCETNKTECCHREFNHSSKLKFVPQMMSGTITHTIEPYVSRLALRLGDMFKESLKEITTQNKFEVDFSEKVLTELQNIREDGIPLTFNASTEILERIDSIGIILSNGIKGLNNQTQFVANMFDNMKKYFPVVLIIIAVTLVPKFRDYRKIIGALLLAIGYAFNENIRELFAKLVYKITSVFAQGILEITEDIVALITAISFGKDFKINGAVNSFKRIKDYSRYKVSVSTFAQDVSRLFQRVINHITDYLEKERFILFDTDTDILGTYLEDVDVFVKAHCLDTHLTYPDGEELARLEKKSLEISRILTSSTDRQKLLFAKQALEPFQNKKRASSWYGQDYRTEPICVLFVGDSHIGKTTVTQAIMHYVMAAVMPSERLTGFLANPHSEIFSWNWERDHADGYKRQFSVEVDDIGCSKDTAGDPNNVYVAIMKMVNIAPYNLNMAELTSKSDTYFASKFVWMTSNRTRFNLNSMYYNEAFVNRLKQPFAVVLKEGYEKPSSTNMYPNFEHLEFRKIKYDPSGMQSYVETATIGGFQEICQYLIDVYRENEVKGETLGQVVSRSMAEGVTVRTTVQPQMRVPARVENFNFQPSDFYTVSTGLGMIVLSVYTSLKMVDLSTRFIMSLNQFVNHSRNHREELITEVDVSEEELKTALRKKPMYYHYITSCECALCNPQKMVAVIQNATQREWNDDNTNSFLNNRFWEIGIARDFRDVFYDSLTFFLSIYWDDLQEEEVRGMCNRVLPSELADSVIQRVRVLQGRNYQAEINRICQNWPNERKVKICLGNGSYAWDQEFAPEDQAIFIGYCCAFYLQRMNVVCTGTTLKEKIKEKFFKTISPEYVRKVLQPILSYGPAVCCSIAMIASVSGLILFDTYPIRIIKDKLLKNEFSLNKITNLDIKNFHLSYDIWKFEKIGVVVDGTCFSCIVELKVEKLSHGKRSLGFKDTRPEIDLYVLEGEIIFPDENKSREKVRLFNHEVRELRVGLNDTNEITGDLEIIVDRKEIQLKTEFKKLKDSVMISLLTAQSTSGLGKSAIQRPRMKSQNSSVLKLQSIDISKYMGGYDKTNRDIGKKVVNRNSLILYIPQKKCDGMSLNDYEKYMKEHCRISNILMLGGRIGLINSHVRVAIECSMKEGYVTESYPLMFIRAGDPIQNPVFFYPDLDNNFYDIDVFPESDINIVKLPEELFQEFMNIKKYFVSKDMPISSLYHGVLYVPRPSCAMEIHTTSFTKGVEQYDHYENGEVWVYPIPTQEGDCGSILTISDKFSGSKKICGFHVAGDGSYTGCSFPLFQEEIEAILKFFTIQGGIELPYEDYEDGESFMKEQSRYPYPLLGKIDAPRVPFRSRLKPSPLHDVGNITHRPATNKPIIVQGKKIYPTQNALWKNIPAKEPLSIQHLLLLYDLMLLNYEKVSVVDRQRSILTFEESVLGIENDEFLRPMTRSTSAGFPYKVEFATKGSKGKQILFGKEELYDLSTKGARKLRQDVEEELNMMKNGSRSVIPYEVSEKDELLPIEKLEEGKIRLFAVNNALGGSLKRMYGGQFRSWFAHNRIHNGSAIGINVYSREWDQMIKYLLFNQSEPSEPIFIAMDVSKFDGTISRPWMFACYHLVSRWYDLPDEEKSVQWKIFEAHMHSFHIYDGKLFERFGSQSSGDDYTALLNTITSQGYFWYACLLIITNSTDSILRCEITELPALWTKLRKHVRLIALGDDILVSINSKGEYYGKITEKALIETYNRFGVLATTDAKDGTVFEYRKLWDVTFLKRRTYYCKEFRRYIGRLELSSITKSVQWMRDNDPHFEAFRLTLEHALEELALYPDNTNDQLVASIIECGKKRVGLNLLRTDKFWLKTRCLARIEFF